MIGPGGAGQRGRDTVDEAARQVVLAAYYDGCRARSPEPFDEALKGYLRRYPHINRELAGHAVAHILATAGV